MLQKLENVYLAILRFVVIVVAGLLLVAVVISVLNSTKAFQSEPAIKQSEPQVSHELVIKQLISKDAGAEVSKEKWDEPAKKLDPNRKYYEQIASSLIKFVQKHAEGYESVNKSKLVDHIKTKAEVFNDGEVITQYAKNLAATIDKILTSPQVTKIAKVENPGEIVDKAMQIYTVEFAAQVEEEKRNAVLKQEMHAARKAEAMQSLYIAAGAFGTFLMIVFISIIIRIERNLRYLENVTKA